MFHRERMTALEKGLPVPVEFWEPPSLTSRTYLLRGLIWLVVGLALPVLFVAMWLAEGRTDSKFLALATMGIVPLGVGAAYLYVRRVEGQETKG
jgi:hypothetical protein